MNIQVLDGQSYDAVYRRVTVVLAVLFLTVQFTNAARNKSPYLTAKQDYQTLVGAYSVSGVGVQQVRPRLDQTQAVTVSIGMNLYGVMDFDAVAGIMNLIGSMTFEWQDDIKTINSLTFDATRDTVFVDIGQIWTPNLVLMNDAESVQRIGDSSYKVRFNLTSGVCQWKPRMIINAACTANMLYYPFDKQVCSLLITPWYREADKVVLQVLSDTWELSDFLENGVWALDSTTSRAYIENNTYYADLEITIKRKPTYLAIVIVLPILLLSLLTGFLFLLPPDSGSRVGFGITCFLSFVVILQTLMQFLPETSVPMSLLCVYIIVMLLFSAGLSIFNVFILRLYLCEDKDEVPALMTRFIDVITCRLLKRTYRRTRRAYRRVRANVSRRWANYRAVKRHIEIKRKVVGYDEERNRADVNANVRYRSQKPSFIKPHKPQKGEEEEEETKFDRNSTENDDGLLFRARNRNIVTSYDVFHSNVTEIAVGQELKKGEEAAVVKVGPDEYRGNIAFLETVGNVVEEPPPFFDDVEADDVIMRVNLTWEIVAILLDYFFILAFIVVQVVFTVLFLVPIYSQY